MAEKIVMPKLAMAMKNGKVVEWKVEEGGRVEKGQIVMVIETEKVSYEVESPAEGYLHKLVALKQKIPVNETVALLAETEEELARLQAEQPAPVEEEAPAEAAAAPAARVAATKGKVKISPVAKKLALKENLDYTRITGSGPGGRIVKRDVQHALEVGLPALEERVEGLPMEMIDGKRVKTTLAMEGMRQAIAEHMVNSLTVAAQLSYMGEVDMSEMIRLRKSLLQKEEEIGTRITYTDLLVFALAKAVKHVPLVNTSVIDDQIFVWDDINIGVAVALDVSEYETGLIVPVVKDAGNKTLTEISRTIKDLVSRSRSKSLTPEDVSGGTITFSNVGGFAPGWTVSTPIINQPQSVLVQPGGIFDRPVARDGQVVVRPIMTMSITFDHRVLDGKPISKFFKKLNELIEKPDYLHL